MKLKYDNTLKIVGLGISPWPRLGPEKWFKNYKILSLYGWDIADTNKPKVYSLVETLQKEPKLKKLNTQNLINNSYFRDLLDKHAPEHYILTYKPVDAPEELSERKFLAVDKEFTKIFENKAVFRRLMGKKINFPEFEILDFEKLLKTRQCYESILNKKLEFVIQDESLSGGKGTFVVRSYADYTKAVDSLNKLSHGNRVVVSVLVNKPKEFSIQACVTKHGVLCGPLQQQLVANKELANLSVVSGDKFCAIQVDPRLQNTKHHQEAINAARKIGQTLKEKNYHGIFGVDFLLDEEDKLYVLEVNPRITGATPLLTSLDEARNTIPFYQLHILELIGADYEIIDGSYSYETTGSLMILHSQSNETSRIVSLPSSGTYRVEQNNLMKVNDSIDLLTTKGDEFIIEEYMPKSMNIKPGNRLMVVKTRSLVIKGNDLNDDTKKMIAVLYDNVKLSQVMNNDQLTTIGKSEYIEFADIKLRNVPARIDTGAKSSAIWVSKAKETKKGLEVVFFDKQSPFYTGETICFTEYDQRSVKSSNGAKQARYTIQLSIKLANRRIKARFTLADRSKQSYPVLIGRRVLLGKFVVNVKQGLKTKSSTPSKGE